MAGVWLNGKAFVSYGKAMHSISTLKKEKYFYGLYNLWFKNLFRGKKYLLFPFHYITELILSFIPSVFL